MNHLNDNEIKKNIASYIDHTLVKRNPTRAEIDKVVEEAIKYKFKSVCVAPSWITYIKDRLHKHGILVTAVIGFVYGQNTIESKVFEAKDAIAKGADELDFVINVSKLTSAAHGNHEDLEYVKKELAATREATRGTTTKVILETGILDTASKHLGAKLVADSGHDFVKTSTAIETTGATVEDVRIFVEEIKKSLHPHTQIKASGGVRTLDQALDMIKNGATRLGSSNGVKIIEGLEVTGGY